MVSFDPIVILLVAAAIVLAITVHEFSHAAVATALGDLTAKKLGRLSLNPIVHLDPLGTIMLFFVLLAGFGIGWGKPVPVNPFLLRGNRRRSMAMVAVAGPASNIVLAILMILLARLTVAQDVAAYGEGLSWMLADFIGLSIQINISLAVFNMIPLLPLDGSRLLVALLPGQLADQVERLEMYGPAILLSVVLADQFFRLGILASILFPAIRFVRNTLLSIFGGPGFRF